MKPKSQAEKALSGTIRLDRTETKRVKVVTTTQIPKPQPYLNANGRRIFKEICVHLLKHKALCKIDSFYVSTVAHSFDIYNRMAMLVESPDVGLIQEFKNGTRNISPEFSIMRSEWERLEKGCKSLGLNLKSRDAILAFARGAAEERPADPIAEMFNRKNANC
jgi:P27 family predicted phage terminase small subunit